jgi:hypothetical protein
MAYPWSQHAKRLTRSDGQPALLTGRPRKRSGNTAGHCSIVSDDHASIAGVAGGWGANPAPHGTPGGASGGAIYTDGDLYTVRVAGTIIKYDHAREGGGAIFFVSDDNTGTLRIEHSPLFRNPSEGFYTHGYPGIYFHSTGHPIIVGSSLS